MKQNITLSIDREVLRKARVLAAERATSVSGLLAAELERIIGDRDRYETAKRAAIVELRRGHHLGGGRLPSRDEIYDR